MMDVTVDGLLSYLRDAKIGEVNGEYVLMPDEARLILAEIDRLRGERDALAKFKSWTHQFLDGKGVPHHPPGTHGAEGCRIGDRMDFVFAELDRLREELGGQEASFDLRHRADMRGISLWRDAHPGNDLVQPDHGDLVCWLIEESDRLRALVPAPQQQPADPGLPPDFEDERPEAFDPTDPAMPRW